MQLRIQIQQMCHLRLMGQHDGTVVGTAASQLQGPGLNSGLRSLSVWSLHVLPMSVWVSSGAPVSSHILKDVLVRCIDPNRCRTVATLRISQ